MVKKLNTCNKHPALRNIKKNLCDVAAAMGTKGNWISKTHYSLIHYRLVEEFVIKYKRTFSFFYIKIWSPYLYSTKAFLAGKITIFHTNWCWNEWEERASLQPQWIHHTNLFFITCIYFRTVTKYVSLTKKDSGNYPFRIIQARLYWTNSLQRKPQAPLALNKLLSLN